VGSFAPNGFGLHDMQGNAWQRLEDCRHKNYTGAPGDGGAWVSGDCSRRVVRGGSWIDVPRNLRAAVRNGDAADDRSVTSGFRLGRTLTQ
jgi:formylglycine-generating enzyme required for sulfatase activity